MFELTINGEVYAFNFGMGFLREVNSKVTAEVAGLKGVNKNIGLNFIVSGILDGDVEALVTALEIANKGQNPRVTRALLDSYIDDTNTDIDAVFESVIDFLSKGNATKKAVANLLQAIADADK